MMDDGGTDKTMIHEHIVPRGYPLRYQLHFSLTLCILVFSSEF